MGSSPLQIQIEDIFLIVRPSDFSNYDVSGQRLAKQKLNLVISYAQAILKKFLEKSLNQKGFVDGMFMMILDNI